MITRRKIWQQHHNTINGRLELSMVVYCNHLHTTARNFFPTVRQSIHFPVYHWRVPTTVNFAPGWPLLRVSTLYRLKPKWMDSVDNNATVFKRTCNRYRARENHMPSTGEQPVPNMGRHVTSAKREPTGNIMRVPSLSAGKYATGWKPAGNVVWVVWRLVLRLIGWVRVSSDLLRRSLERVY